MDLNLSFPLITILKHNVRNTEKGLPVKMEVQVDMLRLPAQPQEELQLTSKQIALRTAKKSNCVGVQQPRI